MGFCSRLECKRVKRSFLTTIAFSVLEISAFNSRILKEGGVARIAQLAKSTSLTAGRDPEKGNVASRFSLYSSATRILTLILFIHSF